ncbi:hypothetical protein H0I23_02445 [Cellulophaga sp. HaHaR_3_176]|uniref:hypothetical protein n=1 Tax=Cellulophaga sp. HaHaR_3_176 TaxID=1942464 RepID=UPI001C1FC36E|nr:hypothetical protein [Cellulophaga sp. HaHaR_3_176]QWX84524.1 hypothetical protein H0I23_02445 [Cellulophaga sp. HaHaR_3_176]
MSLKNKALIFNFLGFAILYILMKWLVMSFVELNSIVESIISAIVATILAPKFAEVKINGTFKLVLKWIFIKGFKEL